jgi:hypothetical protein
MVKSYLYVFLDINSKTSDEDAGLLVSFGAVRRQGEAIVVLLGRSFSGTTVASAVFGGKLA